MMEIEMSIWQIFVVKEWKKNLNELIDIALIHFDCITNPLILTLKLAHVNGKIDGAFILTA